ncbi:MAG TPA: hypothetical protein VNN74_06805 [Candidatus Micrarchaeia archaeon]|nr:hypothetical protein [Candidatus Micrarchaeia archaeon]
MTVASTSGAAGAGSRGPVWLASLVGHQTAAGKTGWTAGILHYTLDPRMQDQTFEAVSFTLTPDST